jgi:hypothetical protein
VQDVYLFTASSIDVQGVSLFTASSVDVQGVSLFTASSIDVVSCHWCILLLLSTMFLNAGIPDCTASGQSGTGIN